MPLHLVTRSIRWKYLLKHEKKGVKFFHRFAANAIGFTVTSIFPGRIGELVRALFLAQKEKMKKGFVIGTIVVERVFDIFTMCFLLGLFMISRPLYSSIFQINQEAYSNLQLLGIGGVAFGSVLLVMTLSLYFFREKTLRIIAILLRPFPQRICERVYGLSEDFIQGLKFFHSGGNLLMYILLSIVVWIGIMFFYWMFFFANDVSLPFFFLVPYVFLTCVGAAIPTPGMVGGFHYFSKLALISFFDIDTNQAVGMTIVVHGVQVVVSCLVGYALLWKEGISLFQVREMGERAD